MDNSYIEIKAVLDLGYKNGDMPSETVFLEILKRYGMPPRGHGNQLIQVNYSIASSKEAIVIGLRYKKTYDPDNLFYSEDYAVFMPGASMQKYYGKQIDSILPEYTSMHKRQI